MLPWQHFLWPYCPRVRFKSSWRASPRPEQSSCSVSHFPGVPVSVRADPAVAVGSSLPVLPSLLLLRLAREPRPPALLSFRRTKVFSALTAFCGVLLSCCFEALGSAPFTPCALKIISIGLRTYFHLIRCFIFKVFPQQFYLKVWWLYCLNTHTQKKYNYFSSRQWRIILEFSKICEIRCVPEMLCCFLHLPRYYTGAYQGISLVNQEHSPDSIEKRDKCWI